MTDVGILMTVLAFVAGLLVGAGLVLEYVGAVTRSSSTSAPTNLNGDHHNTTTNGGHR